MVKNTRQSILNYLAHQRNATAADVSRALNMTRANAQYHLQKLTNEHILTTLPLSCALNTANMTAPRGRPSLVYTISTDQRPNNLPALVNALMNVYLSAAADPSEKIAVLAETLYPAPPSSQRIPHSISTLMDSLNSMAYQARWEAHRSGPYIIFKNCPYTSIIAQHPELCQVDACILEKFLKQKIKQTSKIEANRPGSVCSFSLQAPLIPA